MKKLFSSVILFSLVFWSNISFAGNQGSSNEFLSENYQGEIKFTKKEEKAINELRSKYDRVLAALNVVKDGSIKAANKSVAFSMEHKKDLAVATKFAYSELKDFFKFAVDKSDKLLSIKMLFVYALVSGQVYAFAGMILGQEVVENLVGAIARPFFENTFALLGVIAISAKTVLDANADRLQEAGYYFGVLAHTIYLKFKLGYLVGVLGSMKEYPGTSIFVYGFDTAKWAVGNAIKGVTNPFAVLGLAFRFGKSLFVG